MDIKDGLRSRIGSGILKSTVTLLCEVVSGVKIKYDLCDEYFNNRTILKSHMAKSHVA